MNFYKKVSRIAWVVALIFLIGIFLPEYFGIDGMNGGFALSVFSGFFAMVAIITAIIYGMYGKKFTSVMKGENVIARWEYSKEEWDKYTEEEHKRNKEGKTFLFYIVSGWAVFFGILFPIFDFENGIWVSAVMGGLILLIGFVAFTSIWYDHRRNLKKRGEILIAKGGVILNGQLHNWEGPMAKFHGVALCEDKKQPYLQFDYQAGQEIHQYSARIPIPEGKMEEAEAIVRKFMDPQESFVAQKKKH